MSHPKPPQTKEGQHQRGTRELIELLQELREREFGSSGGGDKAFTAAVIGKYVAIV